MADKKISALTAATTPLDGTEVLPIVQSGSTVKVANNDLRPKQIQSNATSGVLQITGPAASATRVMTVPNANFTAARTDAAQTFTGTQTFSSDMVVNSFTVGRGAGNINGNVAYGPSALAANTTGYDNYASGFFALSANQDGIRNTAVGSYALSANVSNNYSTAVGRLSLYLSTADYNTAVGFGSGQAVTTGANNTFIGGSAGSSLVTGSNNACFGYNTQPSSASVSNEYTYGNSSVTTHRFYGNMTPLGAAKGINFTANTPAAGMTSQLLNWYEEGTWTPVYKSSGGSFTIMTMDVLAARYTRIGRQVTVTCAIRTDNVDATGASGVVYIDGLPFTAASGNAGTSAASVSQVFGFTIDNPSGGFVQTGTTFIYLEYRTTANGVATELPVAALTTGAVANQNNIVLTATYTV